MTGLRAGSGGTGVIDGSRPATGRSGTAPVDAFIIDEGTLEIDDVPVASFSEETGPPPPVNVTDAETLALVEYPEIIESENIEAPDPDITDEALLELITILDIVESEDDIAPAEFTVDEEWSVELDDIEVEDGTDSTTGGPPARTTVPTFREARSSSSGSVSHSFAYDSAGLTGDRSVFLHSCTNVGGVTPTGITLTGIEAEDDSITVSPIGATFSYQVIAEAGRKTITSDSEANVTSSTEPGTGLSNIMRGVNLVTFVGSSVNGDPILQRLDVFDTTPLADGFSLVGNTLTWPTIEVPIGYTAVYLFAMGTFVETFTWATATERNETTNFSGTGLSSTTATLNGPNAGTGVTLTQAGLATAVGNRGAYTAIYLVPGT